MGVALHMLLWHKGSERRNGSSVALVDFFGLSSC